MSPRLQRAVYNARIHRMKDSVPRLRRWSAALLVVLGLGRWALCSSNQWPLAEQELARKIASLTGSRPVSIEVVNQSSLSQKDVDEIRQNLMSDLARLSVQIAQGKAGASIRVTLSENAGHYVAVAEVPGASPPAVVIASFDKGAAPRLSADAPPVVLRKTLLWSQEQPILDAALFADATGGSRLLVLAPEAVSLYRFEAGHWQLDQALPIQHESPWPRDVRGRIALQPDQRFRVFLPGVSCDGSRGTSWTLGCRPTDDPWPLNPGDAVRAFFAPTRNFFTGALSPGVGKLSSTAKFYSGASIPRLNSAQWLFAATDGSVHILDGATDRLAHWKWGSDIASVQSSCGAGTQILATQPEDEGPDTLRAYELPDHDAVPVSAPLEFSGPITALWTESKSVSAIAVSRNSSTGDYEAFRVTVGCGQ